MNKIRFFDGGMGTMLQAAGLLGPGALPEPLNLTHPEEIAAIHQAKCTIPGGAEGLCVRIAFRLSSAIDQVTDAPKHHGLP